MDLMGKPVAALFNSPGFSFEDLTIVIENYSESLTTDDLNIHFCKPTGSSDQSLCAYHASHMQPQI